LALKSGEWFFRFVIWDHFFHKLIHLNYWSEILRPPLTNRLLQQYFPKGTDLSIHSQAKLNAVARQLNERP
jgi:hypothetical protein